MRGFRAVYLGLVFNCFIMASVNLAAVKIANVVLGWPMEQTLIICAVLNVAFAATSGLWGVLVTDFVQFGIAMAGSFAAAYFALQHPDVGGLANLISRTDPHVLALLPDFGDWGLTLTVLIIPLTVQWWSVWYPGAEPGVFTSRSACWPRNQTTRRPAFSTRPALLHSRRTVSRRQPKLSRHQNASPYVDLRHEILIWR